MLQVHLSRWTRGWRARLGQGLDGIRGERVGGVGKDKARLQICQGGEGPPPLSTGTALLANKLLGVLMDREEIQNGVSMRL